jgi:antitoxin (DNA-binding transcriptional repressor) of toxin-antitoxin stability system
MAICGIRELNQNTKQVIETLVETREPVILTRQGQPIATIMPLDQSRLNDLVISTAPDLVHTMRTAERELDAGETRSFDEAVAEVEARHAATDASSGGQEPAEGGAEPAEDDVSADSLTGPLFFVGTAATSWAAVRARARQISVEILDEATERGVLERDATAIDIPLDKIADTNACLYGAALAAEQFRAVQTSLSEPRTHTVEPGEIADSAKMHVLNVNRFVLESELERKQGGITVADYAEHLQKATGAAEASEPAVAELQTEPG